MTDIGRLARERRQRKGSTPSAPDGYQWGTCTGVYDVGRSRPRLVTRVLLASGIAVTAYLAPGIAAPEVDSPVLVSVAADPPDESSVRLYVAG